MLPCKGSSELRGFGFVLSQPFLESSHLGIFDLAMDSRKQHYKEAKAF